MLFCSVESGRHELYVQPFTGPESGVEDARAGRVQISTNGHDGAAWWSPDGKEIRFVDADKLIPSTNCGLAPLSRDLARGKLRALSAGAALLREELTAAGA